MSDASLPPPPQPENVHAGKVVGVGVAALLLFSAASYGAYRLQRASRPDPEATPPVTLGTPDVGRSYVQPFSLEDRADAEGRAARARLDAYGWVDRDAGVIHVPVERAMDALAAGQGTPGGTP